MIEPLLLFLTPCNRPIHRRTQVFVSILANRRRKIKQKYIWHTGMLTHFRLKDYEGSTHGVVNRLRNITFSSSLQEVYCKYTSLYNMLCEYIKWIANNDKALILKNKLVPELDTINIRLYDTNESLRCCFYSEYAADTASWVCCASTSL